MRHAKWHSYTLFVDPFKLPSVSLSNLNFPPTFQPAVQCRTLLTLSLPRFIRSLQLGLVDHVFLRLSFASFRSPSTLPHSCFMMSIAPLLTFLGLILKSYRPLFLLGFLPCCFFFSFSNYEYKEKCLSSKTLRVRVGYW